MWPQQMLSGPGRRFISLFRRSSSARLFSSGKPKASSLFDDRTLGILTLLVSIPTAAFIWKHHKFSKNEHSFNEDVAKSEEKISLNSPKIRKVKYLIIGGGAAGFSAIQAIKEEDPNAQIVLVSKESISPYLRPPLSKELWFSSKDLSSNSLEKLSFNDWRGNVKPLSFESQDFYKESGAELVLGTEAVGFDFQKHQVSLSNGQTLEFERLLIATGAAPKSLNVPIEESIHTRVTTFRNVSDFIKLYNLLKADESSNYRGRNIVVVGGGFLGSELAVSLARFGSEFGNKITQIFPEDGHMGLVFPKYLSQWTTEKVTGLGVNVKSGRSVVSITKNAEKAEEIDTNTLRLILDNGEEIEADHVVIAAGVEPALNASLHDSLPINEETGGLEADQYLRIIPGVFAAGDVVSYPDTVFNCRRRIEHFDHAILSGKLAGQNMARSLKNDHSLELIPYTNQSMFWSDLGPDVGYEAVGIIDSSLTTVGVWARASPIETPKGTELDTSDIRVQPIGQTSISSAETSLKEGEPDDSLDSSSGAVSAVPSEIEKEITELVPQIKVDSSPQISPTYGKGVVFYLKERRIVGILLFNLFNRVNLARDILKEGKGVDQVGQCVRLFNVEEIA